MQEYGNIVEFERGATPWLPGGTMAQYPTLRLINKRNARAPGMKVTISPDPYKPQGPAPKELNPMTELTARRTSGRQNVALTSLPVIMYYGIFEDTE
jgi:hypothetical protein